MGFMIFLTAAVFFAASIAGCFPNKQKETRGLSVAACLMMAVAIISSLVIKEGMLSDFYALPSGLMIKAMLSVAVAAAAAAALALIVKKTK